jgi:hypothetical protein
MINTLQDVSDEAGNILPGAGRAAQEHEDLVIGNAGDCFDNFRRRLFAERIQQYQSAAPIPIRPSARAAASLTFS